MAEIPPPMARSSHRRNSDGITHAIESKERVERLSGDWWAEPYQRDYHRVRLRGLGDCWIYLSRGQPYLHGWFD